ncbi:MAG: hypothetical protein HOV80_17490 [Polyangiaceae bacterium]|nr:hypothetical protein [Polyangiaceae bacterium]
MKQRSFRLGILFLGLGALIQGACATEVETGEDGGGGSGGSTTASTVSSVSSTASTTIASSSTGMGCPQNCAEVEVPDCYVAVCNQMTGVCEVEQAADDSPCEDGQYCTVDDTCQDGLCESGPPRVCKGPEDACLLLECDEDEDECLGAPVPNGAPCTPSDVCVGNAICQNGQCLGAPIDCSGTPVDDCLYAACNPSNGQCEGVPDASQNGVACDQGGDPCMVGKICDAGTCGGGAPKNCSQLDIGCQNGVCNAVTGVCEGQAVPVGGQCNSGTNACNTGVCNASQQCILTPVPDGTTCDDFSTCSSGDSCSAGTCTGTIDPACDIYLEQGFEVCPAPGWVLSGEWTCGVPSVSGPATAYEGVNVVGDKLGGNYSNNLTYETNYVQTPPIGLGTANSPILTYRHWVDTEGSTYDAYNVKVSTDGGQNWSVITNVTPPYNLSVGGQPGWGGHQQAAGWQPVTVDLNPYVGQQIILRFSFRTDGSVQYPGIFIDDVQVGESVGVPLVIGTTSLPNGLVGVPYSTALTRTGGTPQAVWSIVGGTNIGWLSINPSTGQLSGNPTAADHGPVTVTVHIEEPTLPSNFDEETYSFYVQGEIITQTFEGACPNGWTMMGSWSCGVPGGGPGSAHGGTQAIACVMSGQYPANLAYASNHATSPALDLTSALAPTLRFWTWYQTESNYDAFNVKASTDGINFTLLTGVTPAYNGNIASEQAWMGSTSGWVEHVVDLSAYAGQTVYLRFAMRTDGSVQYPGVFIDDMRILD